MREIITQQAVIMALLIGVGILCAKLEILSEESNKSLSALVVNVVNPAVIFLAYLRERDKAMMSNLLAALALSVGLMTVGIILVRLLLHAKNAEQQAVERLSAVYSNCGFMGIPLVQALLGSTGVFYLTAFITVFNALIWTHGVMSISGERSFRSLGKILHSPAIISIILGLLFFFAGWGVPTVARETLTHISNMNTPLAMLVAGGTIARTELRSQVKNVRVYVVAGIKLLLLPVMSWALLLAVPVAAEVKTTLVIAMAAPSAVLCTLLSITYKKDEKYAAALFAFTTLLSVLTLSLIGELLSLG